MLSFLFISRNNDWNLDEVENNVYAYQRYWMYEIPLLFFHFEDSSHNKERKWSKME